MKKVLCSLFFFSLPIMVSNCYGQDSSKDFVSYYNSKYPKNDYKIVNGTVYYKSNTASITSIGFGGITTDSSPGNINIVSNRQFSTSLFIDGFKRTGERYNYSYSLCTTSDNGTVYQKSENMTGYVTSNIFILQFSFTTPQLPAGTTQRTLYMNFLIKDMSSDAVIQGYYKYMQFQ